MIKFTKKRAAIAVAIVLATGSAWAGGAQQKTAPTNAASDAPRKYVVTVANYQIQPTDENGEMIKFYNDTYNIDMKVLNLDHTKYHDLLNIQLAGGTIPDFFYMRDPSTLGSYVKQGVLAELSPEMIQKYAPDIVNVIKTYAPEYMDMGKVNGKQYAIPVVNPGNTFHLPIVYREDWMKKVGVSKVPETLAEFETLMYKFANEDPDGNGKKDTYGLSKEGTLAVFGAFGIVPFDTRGGIFYNIEDGKVINSAVSRDAVKGLEILAKWYKDGVLDPEFITGENQGGYWALSHAFINGRIGVTALGNFYHYQDDGSYMTFDINGNKTPCKAENNAKELKAANPNARIVMGNSLKGPTGKQGMKMYNRLMNFVGIGKFAEKEPGKIGKILQIFNDSSAHPDPVLRKMHQQGPIDKYVKLVDKETSTFMILPPYDKENGYQHRIGAMFAREMPFPQTDLRSAWGYSLGYDKYGIESVIQVGLPLAVKYKAELNKIRDEAYVSMITGDKPLSYFGEFRNRFDAGGYADVEKEANDYYKNR